VTILNVLLEASPDRTIPVVWLSGILQSLNADLQLRLYPATNQRELTSITIDQAAKVTASQTYLRKLCRGSVNSRNPILSTLKLKCTNVTKARPDDELHYPREDDAADGDDDLCLEDEDGLNEETMTPYDKLYIAMPEFMKDMPQSRRDELLGDFCKRLEGADIQTNLALRVKTLIELQEAWQITCMQAQSVYDWMSEAAKVSLAEKQILVIESDDDEPGGRGGPLPKRQLFNQRASGSCPST